MRPSQPDPRQPALLVIELWGLGDLALAMPFLRIAAKQSRVTLVAKPHAAPLLARFAPEVEHVPLTVPWTGFVRKYRLHAWPWREFAHVIRELRAREFDLAVSARHDPRDHLLLALTGARQRLGFPRLGSRVLLTNRISRPDQPHRAEHWRALAAALAWPSPPITPPRRNGRRIVIHPGAGHPVRIWPRERFAALAGRFRASGWEVTILEESDENLTPLLDTLSGADRFIGNDSGPGHIAALLGVPTFTIFGPQLPELFAPQHPQAGWIPGAPCRYKPCFDACRFAEPFCIRDISVDDVWSAVQAWVAR